MRDNTQALVRHYILFPYTGSLPRISHRERLVQFEAMQRGADLGFAVWVELRFEGAPLFSGTFYPHSDDPYDVMWSRLESDGQVVDVTDAVYCYLDPPGDNYHQPITLADITPDLREWVEKTFALPSD